MSAPDVRHRKTEWKLVLQTFTVSFSSCEWIKMLLTQNSVIGTHGEVREKAGLSWNEAKEKDENVVGGKARRKFS